MRRSHIRRSPLRASLFRRGQVVEHLIVLVFGQAQITARPEPRTEQHVEGYMGRALGPQRQPGARGRPVVRARKIALSFQCLCRDMVNGRVAGLIRADACEPGHGLLSAAEVEERVGEIRAGVTVDSPAVVDRSMVKLCRMGRLPGKLPLPARPRENLCPGNALEVTFIGQSGEASPGRGVLAGTKRFVLELFELTDAPRGHGDDATRWIYALREVHAE